MAGKKVKATNGGKLPKLSKKVQGKGKGKGKAKSAGKGKKKASIPSTPVRDTPQFDGVNPRVMLISLKAGALGLNLTVANNVYL